MHRRSGYNRLALTAAHFEAVGSSAGPWFHAAKGNLSVKGVKPLKNKTNVIFVN